MKKFAKLFLSCAAVAALTAAVATSAMAADKTLTATYDVAEGDTVGTVTITCASEDEAKTLLILKPGADATAVKPEDILQIDQKGEIATAVVPILDAEKEEDQGVYTVLIGGTSGDIYKGTFRIGGSDVKIGDVDLNNRISSGDASIILDHTVGNVTLEGDALVAADVDGNSRISSGDASCILYYTVGSTDKADIGNIVVEN